MNKNFTTPLVSVITASYNYARYIETCLRSALKQSAGDLEVIVVDDGSTDNSREIIKSLAEEDGRIKLHTHPGEKNSGLCETLRLGIRNATGKYTAFLESDDLWREDALEKRLLLLRKTGCKVVFNGVELLKMPGARLEWHGSYVARIAQEHEKRIAGLQEAGKNPAMDLRLALLSENKIPTFSCAMLDTEMLKTCSLDVPVPRWLDWWLWMQASHRGCFAYVPEKLTFWRMHPASYNHRIKVGSYVGDSRKLWKGFQSIAKKQPQKPALSYRLLLCLPFWTRMVLRLLLTIKREGPRGEVTAIKYRLS